MTDPSQYKAPATFTDDEMYNAVRQDLMAELDAINLYEAHKAATKDKRLKAILDHIIAEEKDHIKLLEDWLREQDQWDGENGPEYTIDFALDEENAVTSDVKKFPGKWQGKKGQKGRKQRAMNLSDEAKNLVKLVSDEGEDEEFGEKTQRIRRSLDKINSLMQNLREMSEEEKGQKKKGSLTVVKSSFKGKLSGKYRVTALEHGATADLIKALNKLQSQKDRQEALDAFAAELSGDDLKDLMYDVERAGFHNLKKPEEKKAGSKKPTAKEKRERVVENWKDANGGKLDWDERQQLHHFEEYATDAEIDQVYNDLGLDEFYKD